ncbi:hypothetical protein JCM6882_000591 [Rhodosporidiobolus microsporus]
MSSPSFLPSPSSNSTAGGHLLICKRVDCVSVFLPLLLGVLLSTLGLGMVLVSSARYLSLFPDPRFGKKRALVIAVAVVQVVQTSFDVVRVLEIFGTHFGDIRFFLHPRWFDALAPLFAVLVQLQTQFFLLARAHAYATVARTNSRVKWAGTAVLALCIVGSGACGGVTSLEIKLLGSLARLSPGHPQAGLLNVTTPLWLVSSAFIDCTLCIIIGHELVTARKAANGLSSISSQRTLDVLRRLVRVVLRSGIVLALAQTGTAITWLVEAHTSHGLLSSSWVYLPIIVLPKLYSLTYLSILLAPRRNLSFTLRSSLESSSTMLLAGAGGVGGRSEGGGGGAGQPYLPQLTESRRRLFPPTTTEPYPLSFDPSSSLSLSHHHHHRRLARPLAPTPLNAHPVPPSFLPPLHFLSSHSLGRATSRSEADYEREGERDPYGGLMDEDSPVSPHSFPFASPSPSLHSPRTPFNFRPQPLQLAPYAYGVVGSRSVSGPSSASSHHQRPFEGVRHPYSSAQQQYAQRSPLREQQEQQPHPFPPGFVPVAVPPEHLPLSPPLSPRPSQKEFRASEVDEQGAQFVYAPSSPVSPLFVASAPLSSSQGTGVAPRGTTTTPPTAPTLYSRPSKGRMFLPHPPLSTVDEGSTPPRSGGWTAEAFGAGGGVGVSPAGTARASWIPLFGGGGGREEGGSAKEAEEEELVEEAVLAAIPAPGSLSHHPYAFPPSSPHTPSSPSKLRPLLLPTPSAPPLGETTPPRSPRLTERRGAVDLLPAQPGVPLRMEPREGEGWAFPPPRPEMGVARGSGSVASCVAEGRERRREYGLLGGGGKQEERGSESPPLSPPRRLFSHFSSPSTTTLNTVSSSSFSSPLIHTSAAIPTATSPAFPSPARRKGMHHRLRRPLSHTTSSSSSAPALAHGAGGGNDSDTTLDAVLRALRAPPYPLPAPPGLSPSPLPLFPETSSSSSSAPPPPPPQSKKPTRPTSHAHAHATQSQTHHKRARSWTERLHLTRAASSSSSTFGCRDALALERGEGEGAAAGEVPLPVPALAQGMRGVKGEQEGEWVEVMRGQGGGGGEGEGESAGEGEAEGGETTGATSSSSGVERGIGAW